jgi:hypothetical protein
MPKHNRIPRSGDLVKIRGSGRKYWIALNVSNTDHKRGMNTDSPGLHLFSGFFGIQKKERYASNHTGKLSRFLMDRTILYGPSGIEARLISI